MYWTISERNLCKISVKTKKKESLYLSKVRAVAMFVNYSAFLITGLFSNHKWRRLWYSRIFTQIPLKPLYVAGVPQAIRTPCLKQEFGVSILYDLCCFNLFRLLETWSKHEQEDQSRSFFCFRLDCKMFEAAHLSLKSTCFIQSFQTFSGTG